jgi:hypothetical protein
MSSLRCADPTACRLEVRKKTTSNGLIQYWRQCAECGLPFGNAIKHALLSEAEKAAALPYDHDAAQHARKDPAYIDPMEMPRGSPVNEFHEWYRSEYLFSQEWSDVRDLVFRRASVAWGSPDPVCEACGLAKATEVHHKSYQGLRETGRDFLFDLVAICDPCHRLWHGR